MRNQRYCLLLLFLAHTATVHAQDGIAVENAFPSLSFTNPIDFQIAAGVPDTVFIAERGGTIQRIRNSPETTESTEVLDISSDVSTQMEGGLLGFSFHPEFHVNGYLYVYYTPDNPFRSVISRFETDPENPEIFDRDSEMILLEIDQPADNHNGGQIRFGPDGYLYIALGDGGGLADQYENGQDRTTLKGNILRIDVDNSEGDRNYAIPDDNPFVGNEENWREEIFAWGFRNPFRFSFDSETGDLWVADVGEWDRESIHIVEAGKNYGWNIIEGSICFPPGSECDTAGLEMPVHEYGFDGGQSITGGFVYRGEANPDLYGRYFYGDFISGDLWSFHYDGDEATDNQNFHQLSANNLTCFGEDHDGELYLCMMSEGNIYRLNMDSEPTPAETQPDIPKTAVLEQNYPNPFNPATVIRFDLPENSDVRLKVFDMLGRKVETLVSGQVPAGRHEVNFDASGLPSGIYIYRLQAGSFEHTRRMTLVK